MVLCKVGFVERCDLLNALILDVCVGKERGNPGGAKCSKAYLISAYSKRALRMYGRLG